MKKPDTTDYTWMRLRQLRGDEPSYYLADEETSRYTSKRIRELRDGESQPDIPDGRIAKYCSERIQELRLEQHSRDIKLSLDNRKLGCYAISTIGDTDGDY